MYGVLRTRARDLILQLNAPVMAQEFSCQLRLLNCSGSTVSVYGTAEVTVLLSTLINFMLWTSFWLQTIHNSMETEFSVSRFNYDSCAQTGARTIIVRFVLKFS